MNKPINPLAIGVVGPGRMGAVYARIVDELAGTRLVAICGHSAPSTQTLARRHGVPGYPDAAYQRFLGAHPDIEAVIVATSEWDHTEPVLAAMAAGKHVLVEKPMAVSVADGEQMVQAAEAAGVRLMVCHSLRFDPRYVAMRQAVAEAQTVGDVLHMYGRRNIPQSAANRVLGRFPLAYWLLPHDIDMMLWTAGSPAVKVKAYARSGGQAPHDFIIAVVTFANGAIGVLENSWGSPLQGGRPQNELFSVRGTGGAAEVLGREHGVVIYGQDAAVTYPDTGYTPVVHQQQEGIFRSMVRHFAGVVRGLWPPVVTGQDGLAAIRVSAAIDHSLREGCEVSLS